MCGMGEFYPILSSRNTPLLMLALEIHDLPDTAFQGRVLSCHRTEEAEKSYFHGNFTHSTVPFSIFMEFKL